MESSVASPAAPEKGTENPEVNNLLLIAQALRDEKDDLFVRIGANREILRNYAKLGYLSSEQVDAIGEFYPAHRGGKASDETATETAAETPKKKN
jgi:hypothetical protein